MMKQKQTMMKVKKNYGISQHLKNLLIQDLDIPRNRINHLPYPIDIIQFQTNKDKRYKKLIRSEFIL